MIAKFQIGKNGLNEGVIKVIKNAFKTRQQVRISLLKTAGERKEIEAAGEKICKQLGKRYRARIIGFTIIINKK